MGINWVGTSGADNNALVGGLTNTIDTISGAGGNDTLYGGAGDDYIYGETGNDFISGDDGSDYLFGGDNDDIIIGGEGNDVMYGEGGNDIFWSGLGNDQISGGAGTDRLDLSRAFNGMNGGWTINMQSNTASISYYDANNTLIYKTDNFSGIENFLGSPDDDFFIAKTGTMVVGGRGRDTLELLPAGLGGSAPYTVSFDPVTFQGTASYQALVQTGPFTSSLITYKVEFDDIDTLRLSPGNDTMVGSSGVFDITVFGLQGNDVLDGGAGIFDTAGYMSTRSNYVVRSFFSNGSFVTSVVDTFGLEGNDALINFEALSFNNIYYELYGVQQNLVSNMDGQRYDDVLFQNSVTGQIIYQNMQDGVGTGFVNILIGMPQGWKVFSSNDISGDGRAETFLHDINTGTIYAYNTAPGATPWTSIVTGFTSNFQPIATGDVTRDGVADIVVRDNNTGEVFIGDINAGGVFGGFIAMPNVGTGWRTVGLGDFNRDGASDILIQNIADGTTYYRDMVNNTWGVVCQNIGGQWVAKEAADLTGDGVWEVIFQNTSNGNIWYRDLVGGSNYWGVVANGLTGWDVKNTADVDNDGYRDVIIQNTTDGITYYADMNQGSFSAFGVVTSAVGTNWLAV